MNEKLFHESWYRIAGQRLALRSGVFSQRQIFRGETWHILRDPFSVQFYRLRPASWRFVARLDGRRTVEDVWKEVMAKEPDDAPGQADVIELLGQLDHANMLSSALPPDSARLFERYKKKKREILKSNLMNIMFFRIPLFDPDRLLQRAMPLVNGLISRWGAAVWTAVVLAALKACADNVGELGVQSQGILAPSNLFFLYLSGVVIKTLHEFGHAAAVRRFGGEVHVMGVMFLIFTPLPYMDASAAWAFRSKWERAFVGAAGMVVEVFVASLAALVWAHTGPGAVHSIAYNMMFIASVSTVIFNLNPLLRYDGYYILQDVLEFPNLHQRADGHLTYLVERHAFGLTDVESPARTPREGSWLATFGVLSGIYRVLVFGGILLFVADRFLLLGLIAAAVCGVMWVAVPLWKLVRYLATNPRLFRVRDRAWTVTAAAAAVLFLFLNVLPFPFHFKAPGVLKAVEYAVTVNRTAGSVAEVLAPSGARVHPGDPLVRLRNPELLSALQETQAGLDESRVLYQRALNEQQADLKPLESRMAYFDRRLERLEGEKAGLVVRSDIAGLWVAPDVKDTLGMWLDRGTPLGQVVNDDKFQFVSVVRQEDVSQLFAKGVRSAEVKLIGQADVSIPVETFESIPMEQTQLPSAALGWAAGGDVAVASDDRRGLKTVEPYYQVRAVVSGGTPAVLMHGRSGKVRFALAPKPLMQQGWLKLRQLVQKRYHV